MEFSYLYDKNPVAPTWCVGNFAKVLSVGPVPHKNRTKHTSHSPSSQWKYNVGKKTQRAETPKCPNFAFWCQLWPTEKAVACYQFILLHISCSIHLGLTFRRKCKDNLLVNGFNVKVPLWNWEMLTAWRYTCSLPAYLPTASITSLA